MTWMLLNYTKYFNHSFTVVLLWRSSYGRFAEKYYGCEMIRYSSKSHSVRCRPREARERMEINSSANLAVGSKCFSWSVLPDKLRLEPQMKLALHAVTSFSSSPSVSILLASEAQKNVGRVDVIKFPTELCHFRDNSARVSAKCPSVACDSSKKKWNNR